MNINFKLGMYSLAISSALFFIGCGGGETNTRTGNDGDNPSGDVNSGGDTVSAGKFKYNRVSIAGSSITWGGSGQDGGYLGEKSYVGEVERYLREEIADTLGPDELKGPEIPDNYSYGGKLKRYAAGTTIKGNLKASDEIIIVYGGSNATVEMEVDGQVCGTHTIRGSFSPVKILNPRNQKDGVGQIRSFRETDERAVNVICKNLPNKSHKFKLTVKSGELHLNFITNHMYYMQNAGIGGYRASDLLKEKAEVKNTTTDQIIAFKPDLFILESATNDAQPWATEGVKSTNNWKIETPTSCSVQGNKVLTLNTSGISKGDVVVIGTYTGDIKTMAVGIVSGISGSDIVLEERVTNYGGSQVSGQTQCRVKDISSWSDDVKEVVKRVKAGVGSAVKVGIGTSGVPNYWNPVNLPFSLYSITSDRSDYEKEKANFIGSPRRLLGYREVGERLASEKGWMFFDFFKATMAKNSGVDKGHNDPNSHAANPWVDPTWSIGDNTHPRKEGYAVFASAITEKI